MTPGSARYMRGLGYIGTTAEEQRNWAERATGLDFTGSLIPAGGSGITVGAAPTTIVAIALGAGLGAMMRRGFGGILTGAAAGAIASVAIRGAGKLGL